MSRYFLFIFFYLIFQKILKYSSTFEKIYSPSLNQIFTAEF